jgi:hypothetical protein
MVAVKAFSIESVGFLKMMFKKFVLTIILFAKVRECCAFTESVKSKGKTTRIDNI